MSIDGQHDIEGLKQAGALVTRVLKTMKEQSKAGMSTWELDQIAKEIFEETGAKSAPNKDYEFPGYTCISVNEVAAHGIPSKEIILQPGDLINIDVSAELHGYYADTGHSFQIAPFSKEITKLCVSSRAATYKLASKIKDGMPLSTLGKMIEKEAHSRGYKVIRNLCSHGLGKKLHEYPDEILPFYDRNEKRILRSGMVITLEPFLSMGAREVEELDDGWSLATPDHSFVAQNELSMIITKGKPIILTPI